MKMSEILRDLADKLASIEQGQGNAQTNKSMGGTPIELHPEEPELADDPIMSPPLQQKHELLKKVAGVDNAYDREAGADSQPDELARMKKVAGIVMAGDENDIN